MSDYLYRVVSRVAGSDDEWGPVETGKRIYFQLGTARGVCTTKRTEHEYFESSQRRWAELSRRPFTPTDLEFAVQWVPIGEWAVAP